MIKKHYSKDFNYKGEFQNLSVLRRFEGGIEYYSETDGKYFAIINESTLSDIFDGLDDILITIIEFRSKNEFEEYITKRKN